MKIEKKLSLIVSKPIWFIDKPSQWKMMYCLGSQLFLFLINNIIDNFKMKMIMKF